MTVRAVVELVASTVDPHGWDAGLWDVDVWSAGPVVTDISCDWQGATIAGGRNGPLDRFRSAHTDLRLDNRAGVYNSWSDLTPWAPPGTRHLGAGTPIRVGLDIDGHARVYLFAGLADTWHHRRDGPDRWVEVGADDALADLALANLPQQASQGAGETAGPRLTRILMANGLDTVPTRFDAGVATLQATTLADSAAGLVDLTADSDGGWLWCDGTGTVVYYQGDRDQTDPRWLAPVVVLADDDTIPGAICWDDAPELDDDRDAVVNHVDIAPAGGSAVVVDDLGSQARYGVRTFQRHDLIFQSAPYATAMAAKLLARLSSGGTRPNHVTVTPRSDADAYALASLLWHDRVRVVVHEAGDVFVADSFVDAYSWALTPLGDDRECYLSVTLTLSPAVTFADAGRWDTALWGQGTWGY